MNELEHRVSTFSGTESNTSTVPNILKILQEDCPQCLFQDISTRSGHLPTSLELLLCVHKQQIIKEKGINLSLEEIRNNIDIMRTLEKLAEGQRSKPASMRSDRN